MFWSPFRADFSALDDAMLRRYIDLIVAVYDHAKNEDIPPPEEVSQQKRYMLSFDGSCGYILRLEVRKRNQAHEAGFTLIQKGLDLHSPILRATKRAHGAWMFYALNTERANPEMHRLLKSLGMANDSQRHTVTDLSANIGFGRCCQMMLFGFLSA